MKSVIPNTLSPVVMVDEKSKPQALIIDDEVDICYLLKGILRYKNIQSEYVTSLTAAKNKVIEQAPSVIFLDNYLKDGFGIENISYFKSKFPKCKLVMITAHDTANDRERAYNAGADFFIGKPFTRDIILKTIEKIGLMTSENGETFPH
ncbi:response regulator [Terrimonas sp. NA20]|uniref:Response regulator n=1 Tax=Terrimonas ginsenosidimutans TaxID=2908004 RepID=A0ABS9KUW8_9BACT|nr:response regulator [Terrimonas ginsenosidimutans]MCG2616106.1 response regulator [Terrimonas ginsenosidimutans]